ncbi:MAG: HEAT repeat domain-containing protein [Labilithrix sp.]|nr:HEAT repeat domain-containing protein [Labilithrix sp.]MCW5809837.1 HEAT repeat domain-containing protein [Labilithrix sp.]
MKKKLAALAGFLLLAAGVFAFTYDDAAKSKATTTAAPAEAPESADLLMFRYAPDTTYAYALRYESRSKTVPMAASSAMGEAVEGDLSLEGTLEIHAYGEADGAMLLGYSLHRCKGHFAIGGQSVFGDASCASAFEDRELLVRVDRFGRVVSVHAPAGGASLFDYAMRALVQETQVHLVEVPGTTAWVETETLPQGTVESLYRFGAHDELSATIERTRPRYTTLGAAAMMRGVAFQHDERGAASIAIAAGVLARIHGEETLTARAGDRPFLESTTEIELEAQGSRADERGHPDLSAFTTRKLDDMPESTTLHARILEQRAAGLSWAEALDTLSTYGDAGRVPDHNRFLWRTTALLELDPKRAFDLIEVFENGRPGGKLRGLVMDLLASVPTKEAQEVLRRLLASEQAKSDPRYTQLLQRIGFVTSPDKETISFMKAKNAEATAAKNKNERLASAYTLGTLAGQSEDEVAARAIVDDLTVMLHAAPPNEAAHYLTALGNTRSSAAVPTIAKYAASDDPRVRAAAAGALDHPPVPAALEALLRLVADPDRDVQYAAIRSLDAHKLDASVVFRLAAIANDGKILPSNVRYVLDVVKTYRFVAPREMEALLRALLAHPIDDDLVQAAAQQLLDAR